MTDNPMKDITLGERFANSLALTLFSFISNGMLAIIIDRPNGYVRMQGLKQIYTINTLISFSFLFYTFLGYVFPSLHYIKVA
jgi:hypothetical protein